MASSPLEPQERESSEPAHRFLRAGALSFHYLEWGSAARPALLLFHGGGQNAHTWNRVGERFREQYHVIAPDARGHGESDWTADGDYSVEAMREDVRRLAEELALGRFVLAGMSLGGMVGLSYAATHGETLSGLIVIDFAPELKRSGSERMVGFLRGRDSFASLEEAIAYVRAFSPKRTEEGLRRSLPRNLRVLPDGRLRWKWDPAFLSNPEPADGSAAAGDGAARRKGPGARMDLLWEAAARVPCPALVVHGWESDLLGQEAAMRLARTLPHGRYVAVEGAGHAVQSDNPHGLAGVISEFLREIDY